MPAAPPEVFTVGHGTQPAPTLVESLTAAGVTVLVDVRRHPGSRRHPQFSRDALAATLADAGIAYEWAGEALGGRRSRSPDSRHTALRHPAFAGYADHTDTAAFREAVDALAARATAGDVPAVMCAESVWWRCHRRMIADALVLRGTTVTHLLPGGRRAPHPPHPVMRRGADGWPVYDQPEDAALPGW